MKKTVINNEQNLYSALTSEQEHKLFEEYEKTKSSEVKDKLFYSNLKLVNYVLQKSISNIIDYEDLLQVGYIALEKAINEFDYKKRYKFSTFAYQFIEYALKKEYLYQKKYVKFSKTDKTDMDFYFETSENLLKLYARPVTEQELANYLENTKYSVKKFRQIELKFYLFFPKEEDLDSIERLTAISQEFDISDELKSQDLIDQLFNAISKLNEKEIDIIYRKYGLYGYQPQTLQQIADVYMLSKERIRQILAKSLFIIERQIVNRID